MWLNKQDSVSRQGLSALNLSLDFDEVAVLQENMTYLHNTLEVIHHPVFLAAGLTRVISLAL